MAKHTPALASLYYIWRYVVYIYPNRHIAIGHDVEGMFLSPEPYLDEARVQLSAVIESRYPMSTEYGIRSLRVDPETHNLTKPEMKGLGLCQVEEIQ